jgi:hypothetical protein
MMVELENLSRYRRRSAPDRKYEIPDTAVDAALLRSMAFLIKANVVAAPNSPSTSPTRSAGAGYAASPRGAPPRQTNAPQRPRWRWSACLVPSPVFLSSSTT